MSDTGLLRRNIPLAYGLSFFQSLIFAAPITTIFIRHHLHTVLAVSVILTSTWISSLILDIPFGMLADKYGRRSTLVVASTTSFISLVVFAFSTNYAEFIVYAILTGMVFALNSGTLESMLFDTTKAVNIEHKFKHLIGRVSMYQALGFGVGSVVGGFLATVSLRLPVLLSLMPLAIALILSLMLADPPRQHPSEMITFMRHARGAFSEIFSNDHLLLIVLTFLLLEAFSESMHQISQLFYVARGVPIQYIGIVLGVVFAMSALGSFISSAISHRVGDKTTLLAATCLSVGTLFAATLAHGLWSGAIMALASIGYGVRGPILSHMTNKEVSSHNRTTVLSIRNFASSLGFAIFSPVLGLLADSRGIAWAFRVFSVALITALVCELYIKDRVSDDNDIR